ncbi:LysR family transcriptional regulator [Rhodobacteraceae bacterium RKSG542]|uniref:LysR family transcriptional regulator n=1 Tax=Pseudovibrio flavus TaxID=2529854 RepID=UPI0012BCAB7B|nr:LysR family transcriptional regulator [Pseudovibrio flavus]MTI15830.1 LysR family transcriptional regulator [Pseudovibrio flavus]
MAHSLDIDQLRTFLAISEMGSFTRAGEVVHKTQSAVSMQMRKLEERVGQPLFVKDGRNSRLTKEGQKLREYAGRIVALNDETLTAFEQGNIAGNVRIGLPDDYAEKLLPQVLASFNRINPFISVEVECSSSAIVGKRIKKGELDLGIVTSGDCSGVDGQVIRQEQLLWVGSGMTTLHMERPVRVAAGDISCSWRAKAIHALDKAKIPHTVVYTSASATALSGAIHADLAIGVLPESAVRTDHRILGVNDGMPLLPDCQITLIRSDAASEKIHQILADHIIASIGNMGQVQEAAE